MDMDAAECCTFDETPEVARTWVRATLDGHHFALMRGDRTVIGVFDDFGSLTQAKHADGEAVPLAPGESATYYAATQCATCGNVAMTVVGTVEREIVSQ